jgi:plasmid stabilization system protein ParE
VILIGSPHHRRMTYEFHPDALAELEQAAHYYGREAGLEAMNSRTLRVA